MVSTEGGENLFWNRGSSFLGFVDNLRHLAAKSKEQRAAEPG